MAAFKHICEKEDCKFNCETCNDGIIVRDLNGYIIVPFDGYALPCRAEVAGNPIIVKKINIFKQPVEGMIDAWVPKGFSKKG